MKSIKVMCDYGCQPLWHYENTQSGEVDPKSLSISKELTLELSVWASEYDLTLNRDYPPESGFESEELEATFIENGLKLAIKLKDELTDISVFYFDNRTHILQKI